MMIQLTEEYRLTSDDLNFIVEKRYIRTRKSDNTQYIDWTPTWFFPTIESAMNKVIDVSTRGIDNEGDIKKLITKIDKLKKDMIKLVKESGIKIEKDVVG